MKSDQGSPGKVFQIFNHLYNKVETLDKFVKSIVPADQWSRCTSGSQGYNKLLSTTLVCHPHGVRALPKNFCLEQQSQQNEIITRVVERILRRDGRSTNLLAFGYRPMSENPYALVSSSSWSIESFLPNANVSRFLYTPWKTLLSYIGDDVMEYLLENLVVFLYASSSCYIQLNGIPLFELWPFKNSYSKSYPRSKVAKRLCNSLLSSSWHKKRGRKSRKPIAGTKCSSTGNREVGVSGDRNEKRDDLPGGEVPRTRSETDAKSAVVSANGKRKLDDDTDGYGAPPSKRLCMNVDAMSTETPVSIASECHLLTDEFKQTSQDFEGSVQDATAAVSKLGGVSSIISAQVPSAGELPIMSAHCSSASERRDSSSIRTLVPEQGVGVDSCMPSTSAGSSSYFSCESTENGSLLGLASLQQIGDCSRECPSAEVEANEVLTKKKKKRKRKGKCGEKDSINCRPFNGKVTLKYSSCFYSQDLNEKFPPAHCLSGLTAADAPKIVKQILETDVFGNPNLTAAEMTQMCSLPERYEDVKSQLIQLIRLFLRNHQLCRYKYLLTFHCPAEIFNLSPVSEPVKTSNEQQTDEKQLDFSRVPVFVRTTETLNNGEKMSVTTSAEKPSTQSAASVISLSDRSQSKVSSKSTTARSTENCRQSSNVGHLLELFTTHRQVYLFVRSCCLMVIPTALFGSATNRNVFFRNISRLISTGRFEQLSLGGLMTGMKVCHCRWMAKIHSNSDRLRLLAKVVYWLMNNYVVVLLRSHFYITDSTGYRNRMFYYRKSVWKVIHSQGLAAHLSKGIFQQIDESEATRLVSSGKSLGVASMRFLPKSKSLRPIVNMSRRQKMKFFESTINNQLRDCQQILKYAKERHQVLVGSSVSGLDDIYNRWKKFVDTRKQRNDSRPLYFVKADIEDCYNSIDQKLLYEIIGKFFQQSDDYIIRKYVSVVAAGGRLKRSFFREAVSTAGFSPSFLEFIQKKIVERKSNNTVFVDQLSLVQMNAAGLLSRLQSHIFHSLVRLGRKYFKQIRGIGQGSVISTLLCDIYYGKMEFDRLTVDGETEILMRQVDDFLFVTPDYHSAVRFLHTLLYGVADYNCSINRQKTIVNFAFEGIQQLPPKALLPWCGLLIDTGNLGVYVDYTRYAGVRIADSITNDNVRNPGRAIRNKLMCFLRRRCHQIFLDPVFNSSAVITANIYQAFLLAAFKFHSHIEQLPVRNSSPVFLVDTIYEIASFIEHKVRDIHAADSFLLRHSAVQFLCLRAFVAKLEKHQGGYHGLLKVIRKRLGNLHRSLDSDQKAAIDQAITIALPAEFSCML